RCRNVSGVQTCALPISERSDITGFDSNRTGNQELEISYEENGKTIKESVQVSVKEPSLDGMQQQVENFQDKGEIADESVARLLDVHLESVKRFEDTEQTSKVLKHLNGFNHLLDYQRDQELITEDAYDSLVQATLYLIEEAS